jgi:hypothetical protein
MYLLRGMPSAQDKLCAFLEKGVLRLLPLGVDDAPRMRELMHKYRNRPMDFADAVYRADFEVYRIDGKKRFRLLPKP